MAPDLLTRPVEDDEDDDVMGEGTTNMFAALQQLLRQQLDMHSRQMCAPRPAVRAPPAQAYAVASGAGPKAGAGALEATLAQSAGLSTPERARKSSQAMTTPERLPHPATEEGALTPARPAMPSPAQLAAAEELLEECALEPADIEVNYDDQTKELGTGGFGAVYLGKLRDPATGTTRDVAVKKLKVQALTKKQRQEMANEAKAMHFVGKHENIVAFLGHCTVPRHVCIVMEYVDGGNLFDLLFMADDDLTPHQRKSIAMDVAVGMRQLHSVQVVHRDLKPQNGGSPCPCPRPYPCLPPCCQRSRWFVCRSSGH